MTAAQETDVTRFRSTLVVEAHRWWANGDHPDDYAVGYTAEYRRMHGWEGDVVRFYRHPDVPGDHVCADCGVVMHRHGWMEDWTGGDGEGRTVCPGDWIVDGVHGHRFPLHPVEFAAAYEPVDES